MATDSPWGQQALTYHAREDRRMLDRLPVQPGVVGAGDFKITPVSGLQLQAAAGDAWIAGSHAGVTRQGLYPVGLGAAESGITVGAAHATLPRIDQIVLRIRDSAPAAAAAGDAENSGKLEVVAGTATAGATLDNRTGAAALPVSTLRLADILVPAAFAGPFVQNTHIRDRRPWAHGAFVRIVRNANAGGTNNYVDGGALALLDSTNLYPRIECSGVPVRATLTGRFIGDASDHHALFSPWTDGSGPDGLGTANPAVRSRVETAASAERFLAIEYTWVPTAGSHRIGWAHGTDVGNDTLYAADANPLVMTIEELLVANASNDGA